MPYSQLERSEKNCLASSFEATDNQQVFAGLKETRPRLSSNIIQKSSEAIPEGDVVSCVPKTAFPFSSVLGAVSATAQPSFFAVLSLLPEIRLAQSKRR